MLSGRIMCLDIGDRRIGVAVSDMLGYTAQGVGVIQNEGTQNMIEKINELIKTHNVEKLVIGYPLNLDGREGNKALSIRLLKEEIEGKVNVPVILWDERFSTKEAQWVLNESGANRNKQKKVIDMLAAQVILQGYLDAH